LRDAIISAGPGYTIDIPEGTYLLTNGGLIIDKDLTLIGAGVGKTIIQAAMSSEDETMSVLRVPSGGRVAIMNMTVRGGKAVWGGGIYNHGELTLTDIEVTGNVAEIQGGGIFNLAGGTLTMTGTMVSGNVARHGGGIFNDATITVGSSTLTGNNARYGKGGGLHNGEGGIAYLTGSTVSGNKSRFGGGGIYSRSELSLVNTIVSGNSAGTDGGGVFNWDASLSITNSTVSHNDAVDEGGGVYNVQYGMMTLANSIIAMNVSRKGPDCFTSANAARSLGHNLVSSDLLCHFEAGEGDLVGTADNLIDPLLGILQDNGGPTWTHALLIGSPAIDAGDDDNARPYDQRGVVRPQGAASDIGAFERGR
jgi:predicted outer membrane repeat protein